MAFLGQEEQIREYQDRFKFVYFVMFIALGLLLSRMIYLQILKGDDMRQFSEENRIKRVKITAPRGMIFDRNKTLLIDNRPAFDLEVIPQYLREATQHGVDPQDVLKLLSQLISMPVAEIQETLHKNRGAPFIPIKIKTDLSRDEVAKVESWKISMPGVQVEQEIKRTNIYGQIAAHLLGYIGDANVGDLARNNQTESGKALPYRLGDNVGKSGLEERMEGTLRGRNGEKLVEVDALGRIKMQGRRGRTLVPSAELPAVPGKNLILTIDQDLQLAADKAFGSHIGSVVAIDPNNGQILAMLSKPSFDPTEFSRGIPTAIWNKLRNDEQLPLRDKTIQDHYPPASVFKVLTAIAGLEEGVIDENTTFSCGGVIQVGNRPYHCHSKRGHGNLNVTKAITQSCDIFFYRVAQKLGDVDLIAKWAVSLGLGKKTGVNLPHEVPGLIPTQAWKKKRFNQDWIAGETLSVAIGQGYLLTTAIQLANAYGSIANGGTLYRPYLVDRIETFDGDPVTTFKPDVVSKHQLKPKTMELIQQGLWGVVNGPGGTAIASRLPGMDFVGKTGTSQVIRLSADKIYQKCENMKFRERHHGLFAGFAPASHPKIAVAVIAEHGCHGNSAAAPVAKAVIKTYLQKYFPGQYSDEVLSAQIKGFKSEPVEYSSPIETSEDLIETTAPDELQPNVASESKPAEIPKPGDAP